MLRPGLQQSYNIILQGTQPCSTVAITTDVYVNTDLAVKLFAIENRGKNQLTTTFVYKSEFCYWMHYKLCY